MTNHSDNIYNLILAYLEHQLDESGALILRNWISESSENAEYFLQIQDLWVSSRAVKDLKQFDSRKAYARFKQRIEIRRQRKLKAFRYSFASLAVAVLCIFTFYLGENHIADTLGEIVVSSSTSAGSCVMLPDGTEVVLNSNSELKYSEAFGRKDRKVTFTGEAYFKVAHNEKLPFEVNTNNLHITVLGTNFNISDYESDEEPCVTLLDGKLAVSTLLNESRRVLLNPNQKAVYSKSSGELSCQRTSAKQSVQWIDGYLFFDDKLITDIASSIERYYGIKVVFAIDSIKQLRFYGNFAHKGQSLTDILDALATTGKVRYILSEDTITLY